MKKTLVTFAFTLLGVTILGFSSFAQEFRLGLTAAPSLAWMNPISEDYSSEGNRLGFSYGLLADIQFSDQYGLASGLHISYLGGKLKYPVNETINDETYNELQREYRLQLIELPLALKMKSREILGVKYFGKFGLGLGMILKAEGDDRFVNTQNNARLNQSENDIKGDIAFGRASLILGGGAEYQIGGNVSLIGGITFNNGFTNILKNSNEVSGVRKNARANYLELSIGVLF